MIQRTCDPHIERMFGDTASFFKNGIHKCHDEVDGDNHVGRLLGP